MYPCVSLSDVTSHQTAIKNTRVKFIKKSHLLIMSKLRRIDTYSKVPFEGNLGISVYFLTSGPYDKNNIIDGSSVAAHVVDHSFYSIVVITRSVSDHWPSTRKFYEFNSYWRMAMDRMALYPLNPILNLIDHSRCFEEVWWSPYIINKYINIFIYLFQLFSMLRNAH
jgi:hypothetical protein